ncbi:PLP-dependent aminotransferase family protein [Gallaecimonas xiamenensis]|uniref:GntR family transcriptional regulator n=1 Tax=Gallaecimonas xiamenensis 3-C-1 TaxID=745411 RepID=K2KIU9_9GAMM|nr:PLP-dependent aminotransferase family protein [Gallaecimonas xiamenensis]EKE77155.1 GntR family transcriptional regulator [Gallaecimonas xiamenensis 3-C-1]
MDPIFGLQLRVDRQGQEPLRVQLQRQLSHAIFEGRLKAGTLLPPSRQLAALLGVSRNTVMQVYEQLASEGLLLSKPGSGTEVRDLALPASQEPGRPDAGRWLKGLWHDLTLFAPPERALPYDFALGAADLSLFPFDHWRRCQVRALRQFETQGLDMDWAGYPPLRALIASFVSQSRAVSCNPGQVLVCSGAQQGFSLIGSALIEPGKTLVAMESPGYPMARRAFLAAGARVVEVPVDAEGLMVDALPGGVDLVYVTPSHQFPTTVAMSASRRLALLQQARARDFLIIEDDYDAEFQLGGQPIDALQTLDKDGRVLYVGTFSKCMFGDLRLGFVIVPDWLVQPLVLARQAADLHSPLVAQAALAEFIRQGALRRHVRAMGKQYRAKHQEVCQALAGCPWLVPVPLLAGVHMALLADEALDLEALVIRARALGVNVSHSGPFGLAAGTRPRHLLLGLGPIALEDIAPAMARLNAAVAEQIKA